VPSLGVLASLLALWLASSASAGLPSVCANPPKPPNIFPATVSRVVDGDTIRVQIKNGPEGRVRLIGIDTPEVHESEKLARDVRQSGRTREEIKVLGRLAWNFTKRYLDRKEVGLQYDVQTRDQYGRVLAYVWLRDGTLFNVLILREGYAQILTIPPNVRYAELFLACQREARQANRGLWGSLP
jgi:micrococcal nuclease